MPKNLGLKLWCALIFELAVTLCFNRKPEAFQNKGWKKSWCISFMIATFTKSRKATICMTIFQLSLISRFNYFQRFGFDFWGQLRCLKKIPIDENGWSKVNHVLLATTIRHLQKLVNIAENKFYLLDKINIE